jgi:glycerol-3-phosphate acyltransferase PlsX
MPIAIDAMGGDFYPQHPVSGAVKAVRENGIRVILVGQQNLIKKELEKHRFDAQKIDIVHAPEIVEMSDPIITALRKKRHSSMRVCFDLVKQGEVNGIVSAGNSGAMLAMGHFVLKTIAGIDRPCISALLPSRKEKVLLVDAGANIDCSPHNLLQFAILGSIYMESIHQIENPKIGLLNIGGEEGKGDERSRITYELLKKSSLNFVGNIEGKEFFQGNIDVVVTDGFAGNVLLKSVQGAVDFVKQMVTEEIKTSILARLGAMLMIRSLLLLKKRTDYAKFGGAPLLGLKGNAIVCHGSSNSRALAFGIKFAHWAHQCGLVQKLEEVVLQQQELLKETA